MSEFDTGSGPGQPLIADDAGASTIPLSWPDIGLQPHRFAGIFRMLSGDEKQAFADDIAKVGLKQRVKVYQDEILDGRNRYLALIDEGVFDPDEEHWRDRPEVFEEFLGTDDEALDFVWSLNEQRRHDSASQRAMSAARYAKLRDITQAEAAEKFGVSERQVNSATQIVEEGTAELIAAVDDGRVPAYLGEQLVDLDDDEQREVASKPKGEASAAARQKLQDPPTLAESGPVVKALDAGRFVLFAESVIKVASDGQALSPILVDALAGEHGLLADKDGALNFSRESRLAIEVAQKKLLPYGTRLGDTNLLIATAGLPEDLESLTRLYKEAMVKFDRAIVANDAAASEHAQIAMEAVLFKANGTTRGGVSVNDVPQSIVAAAAVPPGAVPLWGQDGCFEVEFDGVKAIVDMQWRYGSFRLHPVDFHVPFPEGNSATHGYFSGHWGQRYVGKTVADAGVEMLREAHEKAEGKPQHGEAVGLFLPKEVSRITERGIEHVQRGVELIDGQWPALPAGVAKGALNVWSANETECKEKVAAWRDVYGRKKAGFPKPQHLATHILQLATVAHIQTVAGFPTSGVYVFENNRHWRFVDDGSDPAASAVSARLQGAGAIPDRAAYDAALAALTEPKGKLHQATAADAIRAGVAAGISRQQMSDDLGHPIGTVLTWTSRLGLTGLGIGKLAPRAAVRGAL